MSGLGIMPLEEKAFTGEGEKMEQARSYYVGYPTLEGWADNTSVMKRVFGMALTHPGAPTDYGFRRDLLVIILSQVDGDGLVHYCCLPVTTLEYVGDMPYSEDHGKKRECAQQAWKIVRAWLKKRGFDVRESALAFPKELRLLYGRADFLAWDKGAGCYQVPDELRQLVEPTETSSGDK